MRGVPSDVEINLSIDTKDVVDKPFQNPKKILERLEKYQKILDDGISWNDKELSMLKMTLRDTFTYKPVNKSKRKLDLRSWSIIMNMDFYRFYLEETDNFSITNLIASHANGIDLCRGVEINGVERFILEGACFYRNTKAMMYMALISDCDLNKQFKTADGK